MELPSPERICLLVSAVRKSREEKSREYFEKRSLMGAREGRKAREEATAILQAGVDSDLHHHGDKDVLKVWSDFGYISYVVTKEFSDD